MTYFHDDADDTDTGVFIDPLTAQYVYDSRADVEYVMINALSSNRLFADDTFDIISAREEESGRPLACH